MTRISFLVLVLLAAPCLADDGLPMKAAAPAAAPEAARAGAAAEKPQQALPDGQALLQAYVAACGGAEALEGVENAVVESTYAIPAQGLSGRITIAFARPDKIRSTGEMAGVGRVEQGFDGKTGWETNPLTGPRLLSAAELEQLQSSESNVFNLQSLETLYAKAETLGRKDFAGAPAWEVRLVSKSGRESTAYFDVATGLMTGMQTVVASQLGQIPATITLSDYGAFGKLKLPRKSTQSLMGGVIEATTTISSVELNVPAERLPSFAPPPEVEALR